jgi:DNA-binding NtrC family response regulator
LAHPTDSASNNTTSPPTGTLGHPNGRSAAPRVLIVDDDTIVAESLAEFLNREGYAAATCLSAPEALATLEKAEESEAGPFALALLDVTLQGMSGIELLREIGKRRLGIACVMLTGYGTIESAVEALRLGACDYLVKPVVDKELRLSLERAIRQRALLHENKTLRKQLDGRRGLETIVGSDHRMRKIYELIEAVAPSRTTVLMTGESGTGKSLIAHAIHKASPRAARPFIELSCGSIPETLLESELFGHVKGAFTGAHADKVGRFQAADGGTIFLDEINSASPAMQLKLLRVLQERKFEPVGSTQTVEVDARVILASNQPLETLVADGRFRQDLYYRINVVKIELPPLRDRVSDIPSLAAHFLQMHAAELGKQVVGFSPEATAALQRYAFPGNVRELANIVERAAVLSRRPTIELDDLPPQINGVEAPKLTISATADDDAWTPMSLEEAMKEPERRIIQKALKANNFNRQKTAEQLGINRTTLYKRMKVLGMQPEDERAA